MVKRLYTVIGVTLDGQKVPAGVAETTECIHVNEHCGWSATLWATSPQAALSAVNAGVDLSNVPTRC